MSWNMRDLDFGNKDLKVFIFDVRDVRYCRNRTEDFWPWKHLHIDVKCKEANIEDHVHFALPIFVNYRLYRRYSKLLRKLKKRDRIVSNVITQFEIHL